MRPTLGRAVALACILGGSYAYYPYCLDGPIVCPFRLMTGLPCPTCGLTRAFCFLAHGQIAESLQYHWLGAPLFVFTVVCFGVGLWDLARGRDCLGDWWRVLNRSVGGWVWGVMAFQTARIGWLFVSGQALQLVIQDSLPAALLRLARLI